VAACSSPNPIPHLSLTPAAALLRVAEAKLSDFKVKMSGEVRERDDLRRKLEAKQDFGPDQEFFTLFGQCYDTHVDKYGPIPSCGLVEFLNVVDAFAMFARCKGSEDRTDGAVSLQFPL
jgi:hypothetical protein